MNKMRVVSSRGMEIIELFIASLSGRNLNARTIQEYTADLKHFIGWHEYQGMDNTQNVLVFSFDHISVSELETYLQAMKEVKLKASTINRRLSTIKLLFDWAYHHKFSHRNPAKHIKLVPIEKSSPRMINSEEEKRLLDAVRAHGTLRDQAILKLMIHTGLRVGETCGLKLSDISLNSKGATMAVGTEAQQRILPLNAVCKSILERYMPTLVKGNVYLFPSEKTGTQLTERALRHLIKKYMDIAGLEGLSPYSLRHNFGYKKASKTTVKKLAHMMGHSRLYTTMTYMKPDSTQDSLD